MDRVRASMIECGLPSIYWSYAVQVAVYLINRSPSRSLPSGKTPFEMLNTGRAPDLSNLQVFGCVAYSKTLPVPKLEPRSEKCIFLGYAPNGYRLLNLKTKRIITVRYVVFDSSVLYKDLLDNEKLCVFNGDTLPSYLNLRKIETNVCRTTDGQRVEDTSNELSKIGNDETNELPNEVNRNGITHENSLGPDILPIEHEQLPPPIPSSVRRPSSRNEAQKPQSDAVG